MDSLLTHEDPELRKLVKEIIVHGRKQISMKEGTCRLLLEEITKLNHPLMIMGDAKFYHQEKLTEVSADIICSGDIVFESCLNLRKISGNIIARDIHVLKCPKITEITGPLEVLKEVQLLNCPELKIFPKILNGHIKFQMDNKSSIYGTLFDNIQATIKNTLVQAGYKNLEDLVTLLQQMANKETLKFFMENKK